MYMYIVTYYQQIHRYLLVLHFNKDKRQTYCTTKYPSLKRSGKGHVISVLNSAHVYMYMHKQDATSSKMLHIVKEKKKRTTQYCFQVS